MLHTTWMNFQAIMLSEISQSQRQMLYDSILVQYPESSESRTVAASGGGREGRACQLYKM
jgi:hypothetical protein